MYRQGDVIIIPTEEIPKNAKALARDKGRIVLAYGEVTGHAHAISDTSATLSAVPGKEAETNDRFLEITADKGVNLNHEEHSTITLPKGNYIVRRQREYVAPNQNRWVAD